MINERMSALLNKFQLKNLKFYLLVCFITFLYVSFSLKNEQLAHSLFFGEQCEQIAQVAHQKRAM